jgi:hypothetical protein
MKLHRDNEEQDRDARNTTQRALQQHFNEVEFLCYFLTALPVLLEVRFAPKWCRVFHTRDAEPDRLATGSRIKTAPRQHRISEYPEQRDPSPLIRHRPALALTN